MAICVAVCVGNDTADKVRDNVSNAARNLNVGPYTDGHTDFGPLSNEAQKNRVVGYIDKGVEGGANLVADGRNVNLQGYENGYFVGYCVFDQVTPDMKSTRKRFLALSLVLSAHNPIQMLWNGTRLVYFYRLDRTGPFR